jgi:hypothetical protein
MLYFFSFVKGGAGQEKSLEIFLYGKLIFLGTKIAECDF